MISRFIMNYGSNTRRSAGQDPQQTIASKPTYFFFSTDGGGAGLRLRICSVVASHRFCENKHLRSMNARGCKVSGYDGHIPVEGWTIHYEHSGQRGEVPVML